MTSFAFSAEVPKMITTAGVIIYSGPNLICTGFEV
jgi:hypothetical protein